MKKSVRKSYVAIFIKCSKSNTLYEISGDTSMSEIVDSFSDSLVARHLDKMECH